MTLKNVKASVKCYECGHKIKEKVLARGYALVDNKLKEVIIPYQRVIVGLVELTEHHDFEIKRVKVVEE